MYHIEDKANRSVIREGNQRRKKNLHGNLETLIKRNQKMYIKWYICFNIDNEWERLVLVQ